MDCFEQTSIEDDDILPCLICLAQNGVEALPIVLQGLRGFAVVKTNVIFARIVMLDNRYTRNVSQQTHAFTIQHLSVSIDFR